MDRERFDALARLLGQHSSRRAAAVAMALVGTGMVHLEDAGAKRKKKKRCRKLRQPCANSKKKRCCGGLICQDVPGGCDSPPGTYCCANLKQPCGSDNCNCCGFGLCENGKCCSGEGGGCDDTSECCSGLVCENFVCVEEL